MYKLYIPRRAGTNSFGRMKHYLIEKPSHPWPTFTLFSTLAFCYNIFYYFPDPI